MIIQDLFLFSKLNRLYVDDPNVGIMSCVSMCPERNQNSAPFWAENMMHPVYRSRGCEPSACKRPTLFCSSDQLVYQQSGRSKEVCPTKLRPVFKKAPRSSCRGHIYGPKLKLKWRVWAPAKPSGPCVLLEHIWNRAQRCVEVPRDTSARVCKHCAEWKESLLTFRPQAQTRLERWQ